MARVTLATVAEIKSRLRIPSEQTDQDEIIDAYRESVEEDILALTGYTFRAGGRTETFTDWQRGTTRLCQVRPVLSLGSVSGRVYGSQAQFNELEGEIKDSVEGRLLLVGFLNSFYDPRSGDRIGWGGRAEWTKWREYVWPVVKATYTPDPLGSETNPIPKALMRAAVEWVAAIMNAPPGSGAVSSVSIESVSESYASSGTRGSMPAVVRTLLARHIRGTVTMQA